MCYEPEDNSGSIEGYLFYVLVCILLAAFTNSFLPIGVGALVLYCHRYKINPLRWFKRK